MWRCSLFLTAWLLVFGGQACAQKEESPKQFINRFYLLCLKLNVRGVPDSNERQQLSEFLSRGLMGLFEEADRQRINDAKIHTALGEVRRKSIWSQGDYFTHRMEGSISEITVGRVEQMGKTTVVDVELVETPGDFKWTDQLILMQTATGWKVAEIVRGRFEKRNLSEHLKSGIDGILKTTR